MDGCSLVVGFFAYTCGCVVVIEDLKTGEQRHLTGHVEEISTLAVQSDCQVCTCTDVLEFFRF